MNALLLGPILDIIKQVLGGLGLDPALKEQAQAQAFNILSSGTFDQKAAEAVQLAQNATNQQEAKGNWFQAGWRPGIGWVCAAALCSQYILRPWAQWAGAVTGHPLPMLPGIDDQLWQLLAGMLGLGTLRTVEKVKGAA